MTRFASRHGSVGCRMASVTFYPLGNAPGGDPALREANWKLFMPTGVVTDTNWWIDGHAKKHRQQYLERPSSAHATALDKLKKVDDSQTKGKPSLLCFRAKSRPTLFRTKVSIQPEKEGKKK